MCLVLAFFTRRVRQVHGDDHDGGLGLRVVLKHRSRERSLIDEGLALRAREVEEARRVSSRRPAPRAVSEL